MLTDSGNGVGDPAVRRRASKAAAISVPSRMKMRCPDGVSTASFTLSSTVDRVRVPPLQDVEARGPDAEDGKQDVARLGHHLRRVVKLPPLRLVGRRQIGRRAARRRNLSEVVGGGKHDDVVRAPDAERPLSIQQPAGDRHRRAAVERDLLQFARDGEERHPLSIRREERLAGALGTRDRFDSQRVE
jgi:hypothetical protein